MGRAFDPADYPTGCRCACCKGEFAAGDAIVDREVAVNWFTPTCVDCAATDAPLATDHPFAAGDAVVALPDGTIGPRWPNPRQY